MLDLKTLKQVWTNYKWIWKTIAFDFAKLVVDCGRLKFWQKRSRIKQWYAKLVNGAKTAHFGWANRLDQPKSNQVFMETLAIEWLTKIDFPSMKNQIFIDVDPCELNPGSARLVFRLTWLYSQSSESSHFVGRLRSIEFVLFESYNNFWTTYISRFNLFSFFVVHTCWWLIAHVKTCRRTSKYYNLWNLKNVAGFSHSHAALSQTYLSLSKSQKIDIPVLLFLRTIQNQKLPQPAKHDVAIRKI